MKKKLFVFIYIFFIYIVGIAFFTNIIAQEAEYQEKTDLTLLITGDLMLGGRFLEIIDKNGVDYPLQKISPILTAADITYCNMEPPFAVGGKGAPKQYVYQVPPENSGALKKAGFDVVSLANNHIMDFGEKALQTTLKTLEALKILYSGAGMNIEEARRPAIIEKNNTRIGFLCYSKTFPTSFYAKDDKAGTAPGFEQYLREDIPKLKENVDILVVSFHWASITQREPKPYQKHLARVSINLGADIVIGHHPYTIQPLEIYKGKFIFYSVGKLAFGSLSNSLQESMLVEFKIRETEINQISIIPIRSNNRITNFQPQQMPEDEATSFLEKYIERAILDGIEIKILEGKGIIKFPTGEATTLE